MEHLSSLNEGATHPALAIPCGWVFGSHHCEHWEDVCSHHLMKGVWHYLQRALQAQGITPSVSETYPATDMESAIETMTGVTDSCIVNCKQGEVDEVRHLTHLVLTRCGRESSLVWESLH